VRSKAPAGQPGSRLKSALSFLRQMVLGSFPGPRRRPVRRSRRPVRPFLPPDEEKLCAALDPATWRLAHFALLTGLRLEEQLSLDWSAVQGHFLHVPRNRRSPARRVPLNSRALRILTHIREQHPGGARIFPLDKHGSGRDIRITFQRACRAAGLPGFTWYDLRQTYCIRLALAGHDSALIQQIAGHRSRVLSERYTGWVDSKQ
jgi:integrase